MHSMQMTTQQENQGRPGQRRGLSGPVKRLENLLSQPTNRICADCGTPDPKWVSSSLGVFICIKCSGVHRSLGVHISKVLSVKLDEWTDEQVDSLLAGGGNAAVNMRYEAFMPENIKKPRPDSPIEERAEFIRRKYELQQFCNSNVQNASEIPASLRFRTNASGKHFEKQHTGIRHGLGLSFKNSWRKKESEQKAVKKTMGMIEFVGLIKVNIIRGTNLAVRDMMTSDPYVILNLGHQSMKTRVIKSNLNPIWNERLMLSIPEPVPLLKLHKFGAASLRLGSRAGLGTLKMRTRMLIALQVYDKDTFSTDDRMGEAEIDIQPLVTAAKAYENSSISESMQLGKWMAGDDNTLVRDSIISLVDGKVKQDITIKLRNVERGELQIELECVPLSQ